MSGPTSLRICLAVMAPALSEAASSRLKLQDKSDNQNLNKTPTDISAPEKEKSFSRSTFRLLTEEDKFNGNGHNFSIPRTNDNASHLSLHYSNANVNAITGTCASSNVTETTPVSSGSGSIFTTPKTIINHHKSLSKIDHIYQIPEDFQLSSRTDTNILDNLKIMNQSHIAAEKEVETSNKQKIVINTQLFGSKKLDAYSPGMVNGGSEDLRNKSEDQELLNGCNERGDAGFSRHDLGLKSKIPNGEQFTKSTSSMGLCVNEMKAPALPLDKSKLLKQVHIDDKINEGMRKDCIKKQVLLEKRVDTLIRRLKRMKGKVVEGQTREQLRQFVNHQHKNLQMVAKTIKKETPGPAELKEHFLSNDDVKNMSTAQLVKMVKSYQSSKSVDNSAVQTIHNASGASFMDPSIRIQSSQTSERLTHRIHTAKAELDSDATASSSGGESGDEEDIPYPQITADVTLPSLLKRAEWKWAADRAAVVSRWTWLQAQVSDLEYRIRQQSQVSRQLRNNKGGVVLGDPPTALDSFRRLQGLPMKSSVTSEGRNSSFLENSPGHEVSPCNVSAVLSNIDKQALRLTQSLGNCLTPANSTLGSPAGSQVSPSPRPINQSDSPAGSTTTTEGDFTRENSPMVPSELRLQDKFGDLLHSTLPPPDNSCQAARCRPLRSYRKRKILRTVGLYKSNVKAARLSDVRCKCYPPAGSCPMCGGRYNNTQIVDADTMCQKEKVAILDPSFHPVLSFPQDVQLPIQCEGLLKSGHWQNKPSSRKSRLNEFRRQNLITLISDPIVKTCKEKKSVKNNAVKNNTSVINFSTKIKNKYESKTKKAKKSPKVAAVPVKKLANKNKRKKLRESMKKGLSDSEDDLEAMYLEEEVATPVGPSRNSLSSSGNHSTHKEHFGRKKKVVENAFDINNIVIPLSMAANTIVEQPKYKEIVTPKWREMESLTRKLGKTNGVSVSSEQQPPPQDSVGDLEVEDLSDERFAARHAILEQEEKKRHRTCVMFPPQKRKDRTHSAAALDEMKNENVDSENESRPATPMLNKSYPGLSSHEDHDNLQHHLGHRRRSSFLRRVADEDFHNQMLKSVEPWPRRTFPLSSDEYYLMRNESKSSCEPVYQRAPRRLAVPSGKVYVGEDVCEDNVRSTAPSPHPSNESLSSAGDDPNDPEWVGGVDVLLPAKKGRHRKTIDDDPDDPEWNGSEFRKKGKNKR